MKRILSSILMLVLSSIVFAEEKDVFVANNGIMLINVPADKSVSIATFDSEFDLKSVTYETQARTASDSYLMHCFSKKKKDSSDTPVTQPRWLGHYLRGQKYMLRVHCIYLFISFY